MSFYTRLASTASRMVEKYGSQYTFTHLTQGAYNPATGTQATTSSTYTAYAVRDSFSSFEQQSASIEVEDIKLIAEAANFALDDTVTIDSGVYRIIRVNPIKPSATSVAYELQLRK